MAKRVRTVSPWKRAGPIGVMAALVTALVLVISTTAWAANSSVSITEEDEQYQFTPANMTVQVGDSVTWTNDSDAPHTVTSDDSGGPLGSPELEEGQSYSQTFDTAGDYAYHCEIHDYMQGTVHVTDLPPTDVAAASESTGGSPMTAPLVMLGLVAFAGSIFLLRLRARGAASA